MTRERWIASLIGGVVVAGLVVGLREAGGLQGIELTLYDQLLRRATPAPSRPSPILLVEITEDDIEEQGHWPLSDRNIAETLLALERGGARAVGLDLYRNLPVSPGEAFLRRLLREQKHVVAVRKFGDPDSPGIPGPPALEGTDRVGFNDLVLDGDETVRRGLLFLDDGRGAVDTSFALRLALVALAKEGIVPQPDPERPAWIRLGSTTLPPLGPDHGGYEGVDAAGYQFLLDFAAPTFPTVRLGEVLRGEVETSRLRDAVVLIGSNAKSLPDLFAVPIEGSMPGVTLHAHMVDQLLRFAHGAAAPVRVLPDVQEAALILLVALLGWAVGVGAGGGSWTGAASPVAAVLLGVPAIGLGGALAYRAGIWIPMAAPALAFAGAVGLATAWLSSRERAERAELMRIFSRHVSDDVARELWRQRREFFADGRLRPQRLTATVLFVDMKGYSAQAEKMDPALLMEWVNAFMESMARQVDAFGGVVDDYFGDGLKADFGVPVPRRSQEEIGGDARRAAACALAMGEELARLNARYRETGRPEVAMRIGIHTGPVVAGSLGSAERLKYTVVGDAVVTAQRLEASDAVPHDFDAAPCRILVSERTRALLDATFQIEDVGAVKLPGRAGAVPVFRVLGRSGRGPAPDPDARGV